METRIEPGKDKLNLERALRDLKSKESRVGWFRSAKYQEGPFVAQVAAQNEFGNIKKHIPPRPFMRPTIREKHNEWRRIAAALSKRVIAGKITAFTMMDLIGANAAGEIRNTISKIWEPPLSPVTIKARLAKRANNKLVGNLTKPLVDTKIMINSLTYEVTDS